MDGAALVSRDRLRINPHADMGGRSSEAGWFHGTAKTERWRGASAHRIFCRFG
jgi:hypothetical protein